MHLFTEMGRTAIGSRLRRLSEWITDDVATLYQYYGVDLQPKWFPVLYLLSDSEPMGITAIADLIGQSHPSVSKIVRELSAAGLVKESKNAEDGRQNLISLTPEGQEQLSLMAPQIEDVRAVIDNLFAQTQQDLLHAIEEWEYLLQEQSLEKRTLDQKKRRESQKVAIVPYAEQHRRAFHDLNKQWIDQYFTMEPADEKYLQHPQENILDMGGDILVALHENRPVGVCALVPLPAEVPYDYELSKMAVDPEMRGKSIGWLLGKAAIDLAKDKGARSVFLESNTVLQPAIKLYQKLGFRKVARVASNYSRSNIQMAMHL